MPTDLNEPAVVARVANEIEAAPIVALLAQHGIDASTTGGFTAGFRAEAPGEVCVIVRYGELPRARQLLADSPPLQDDVDWSEIDVGEPEQD